jgi:hypothetical protein
MSRSNDLAASSATIRHWLLVVPEPFGGSTGDQMTLPKSPAVI